MDIVADDEAGEAQDEVEDLARRLLCVTLRHLATMGPYRYALRCKLSYEYSIAPIVQISR
jgi:hypothetical protein